MNEYAPWDTDFPGLGQLEGLGQVTMDWMSGPLKQEIDRKYRTLPDRENTMIAGSSMGGLMALYAVTAYNDIFSCAAALSPCIWFSTDRLYPLFSKTPLRNPTKVYMDLGTRLLMRGLCQKHSYMSIYLCKYSPLQNAGNPFLFLS